MTGSTLSLMIRPMARTIAMAVWRATTGGLLRSELRDARRTDRASRGVLATA